MSSCETFFYLFFWSYDESILKTHIFIPKIEHNIDVGSWVSHELPFEEGNVDNGGVEVDELEDEDLECQVVVEIGLSSMHFYEEKYDNDLEKKRVIL